MKGLILKIILNALPIILMIALIPLIENDYSLLFVYIVIISVLVLIKYEPGEYVYFLFGLIIITFFEWFFVRTGAEIFQRRSLLGIMPIWLPFLWAYSFIAIKRSILAINEYSNEKS